MPRQIRVSTRRVARLSRAFSCVFVLGLCLSVAQPHAQGITRSAVERPIQLAQQAPLKSLPRIASPHSMSREVLAGDTYMGVRLLGALRLDAVEVDGYLLGGLSALAWDHDEQLLYALSDRGYLFHLQVEFGDDGLLRDVRALSAHPLRDADGRALRGRMADSEGMVIRHGNNAEHGDTQLVICFERHPRVIRFDSLGNMLGQEAIPAVLRNSKNYSRGNRSLESIAWHPRLHYLIAPEQPMRASTESIVPLYALDPARHWRYPLALEPNAALTAMEILDDGSLLTLERGFGVFFVPVISTLRRVARLPDESGALLTPHTVARFNSGQGWFVDNFEGLAHLGQGRILIVSDDNTKALQSTLLAAFQLLQTDASH